MDASQNLHLPRMVVFLLVPFKLQPKGRVHHFEKLPHGVFFFGAGGVLLRSFKTTTHGSLEDTNNRYDQKRVALREIRKSQVGPHGPQGNRCRGPSETRTS